jgi:hypothetical protein
MFKDLSEFELKDDQMVTLGKDYLDDMLNIKQDYLVTA